MNRLLTILLLAAGTASGQIDNPPSSVNIVDATATGRAVLTATNAAAAATTIGLGTTNEVNFSRVGVGGATVTEDAFFGGNFEVTSSHALTFASGGDPALTRTNLGLGGTNTATFGNVVLNADGNLAPSQTASSGDSLMTRSLYDERLPLAFGLVDQAQGDFGAVTLANGATGAKAAGGFDLITGSSNNATAVWNASSQANFGRKQTTSLNANAAWSTRVMVGWWFFRLGAVVTTTEIRLQYGRAFNATTHAPLSARGVGVRIVTNSVFFETHDGTTGFETTNAVAVTVTPQFYSAIVEAGVAKFFAGQTLVATVTNNVPTNNNSDNNFGWVMSISNTSTNTTTMRVFANPGFVMQQ